MGKVTRNPAGGAEVPQEGGYQEEHRATFGAGTRPHQHIFIDAPLEASEEAGDLPIFAGPQPRCRYCYMTRKETEHGRHDD